MDFTYYFKEYCRFVYFVAFRILKNKEEAEEILQDTFLKFYLYLPIIRDKEVVKSWLYRTSTNLSINLYRRNKKITKWNISSLQNSDSLRDFELKNEIDYLFQMLHDKNKDWHCIYFLIAFAESTQEDVAAIKNTSADNIQHKFKRAKKWLLRAIQD